MKRRRVLVGAGVALSGLFAGCSSDTEDIDDGTRDADDTIDTTVDSDDNNSSDGDDGSNGNDKNNGDEGEDVESENDEPTGSADLEILDSELIVEPGQSSTDVYVATTVENGGDLPSSNVVLQVDWYDEDGNYLDSDIGRLTTLGDGETWAARVYYLGTDTGNVADYELEGEFSEDAFEPAEGLTLVDSSIQAYRTMERKYVYLDVEGRVRNDTGEDQDYVEVVAKIYDGDGNVLRDAWTNVTDLRDGETWTFAIEVEDFSADVRNRALEAADHEILIKDSA
ncbi:FxLYD domain-containing protein [Halosolutus gelatinilyticus]|uniref:FxLYD domain-containing protein n=1 Tax=Halosolutus gelatinilyticus TaxID=2931975 RepID=UPI001FF5433C|nr:FxLYD domain-containing protein [Halosolutus gelatinilyticus]